MIWHTVDAKAAVKELKSDPVQGLTKVEAQARLAQFGPNELVEKGGRTPWKILWEQASATMVLILLAAALIAFLLGDYQDAFAILAIVVLFVLLGFFQDYRAEKAISALKKLSVPSVRVIRDGTLTEVSARELVPGDILQLEAGNILPADVHLIETANLRIQEAALTGESEPVEKNIAPLTGNDLPLGDRSNMAYMGTIVTMGRGTALVIGTGMQTELGRIAGLIQSSEPEQTPLQKRLDSLGKLLAVIGVAIALLVFVLGIWRGDSVRYLLLTAVSVAVAIVPEGLPAVVTITLALGAQRMLKRNALIRKLPAVETLGSVTVICSDKTGTLTENRMTVVALDVADHEVDLTEDLRGDSVLINKQPPDKAIASISLLLIGGALCNDARLIEEKEGKFHTFGDPTEGALVVAAAKMGYWKSSLDGTFPRVSEAPFDSDRKRMTTVHELREYDPALLVGMDVSGKNYLAFTKGSVDGLLDVASQVYANGEIHELDAHWRERIEASNTRLAGKGMRVLGVTLRLLDKIPDAGQLESDGIFIGLFGMIDPPREEVRGAVALTQTAGIRTVMITGDHPLTAAEIGRQLGIVDEAHSAMGKGILTGGELLRLSFDELKEKVDEVRVFARVSPEQKLKIVQALQERGHIVSMTGDGVNDAPALRKADIGVAMGITGTDVSKEASSLVLLDDNFATIVAAVSEGRTIYDNIRKFVKFSVAGNIGKVLVMLLAPFMGKPLPLLPLQLLWLNLLTDGLLGLGMGVEPPEKNIMQRPPYSPQEGIFSRGAGVHVAWVGALIGSLALALGSFYYFGGYQNWQTVVFTFLAFAQVCQALASRSSTDSSFSRGSGRNPLLLGMIALVVVLQLAVVYLPALNTFFKTQPLGQAEMAVVVAASVLVFLAIEVEKWVKRRRRK
jgi:P-type Ca2+ transporter type 2C